MKSKEEQVEAILEKYHNLRHNLTNDDGVKLAVLYFFENMELNHIIGEKEKGL